MPAQPAIEINEKSRASDLARPITELDVTGMTCGNCAQHVTNAIQGVPGVRSARVNLETRTASVRWEGTENVPALLAAVKNAGYEARATEANISEHKEHQLAGWRLNLWLGIFATASLMLGEWVFHLGSTRWFQWFSFVVAAVVQIFAGAPFYRGAWRQLKAASSNMDTLVALGSTTAFAFSVWALFSGSGHHLYFMEAAAIITLISVGHWMESRVSARASEALRKLLNLAPDHARRRNRDGSEREVPVAELKVGDEAALRPGDRVPTDGEVLEGSSAVDESMLTGESSPVDKTAGSHVYAGTVNLNGALVMRVSATGDGTALAHIVAAVERAQTSRASIQRLGDRVSSIFVPIVVLVAVGAGLWWGAAPEKAHQVSQWLSHFLWTPHSPEDPLAAAFITAAAVLIIACPCAMGLATPAAIMAGSNTAAQRGILIRDGVALEKAGRITAVLFDKTGTLTLGKPRVAKVWEAEEGTIPVLQLASSLASHSSHPLSLAITSIGRPDVELAAWREVLGGGVQAEIPSEKSRIARLGSLRWLRDEGVELARAQPFIQEWSNQGATLVGLALGGSLCGLFALKDALKPGAPEVIAQLQRRGLTTWLVTGDNALTAASLAKQSGIAPENVFAEVRPDYKAEFVRKLQHQGQRVAFVGDGINDAPALEQADLGIAVSRASDIAREAADIILLKSDLEAVPESLGLAQATLRTIKQNLFWAFFYNAIGIPLAALGFMSPILCAAAMGLSDLIVLGNALRLRWWRLD